jgi:AraC-like DNA-binding protein
MENWVKTQSIPHLEGVKTYAAHFISQRDAPRHVHHEYVFGGLITGAMEINCGHCGEKHILRPSDILLTEAHEVYSSRALGKPPWRYFSISVSKEKIGSLLNSINPERSLTLPHFTRGALENGEVRQRFFNLHNSLSEEQTSLEQESLLLDWIVSVNEFYADQTDNFHNRRIYSESMAVRRVREFIHDNLGENITLQSLSEIAQLSPFHLNRAFSTQVGLPPHEFQNQLRIEKSLDLVQQKKSLAEIAIETGFSDQSHFNRFFKRYTGVTPKRFFAR